jgi:uncharacterized protein
MRLGMLGVVEAMTAAAVALAPSAHADVDTDFADVMMPGNVDTPVIDALGLDRDHLPLSPLPVGSAIRQTIRALRAGHATIVPDRRLRAVARLTPRRLNQDERPALGRAAESLAGRHANTQAR